MKKFIILATSVVALATGSAFTMLADCGNFEQFNKGVTYTMSNYSGKGKLTSTVDGNVVEVVKTPENIAATVEVATKDEKGKDTGTGSYKITCTGGKFTMDMESFIAPQMKGRYKDMDLKIEGNTLDYPNDMKAGDKLSDGTVTMHVIDKNSGSETSSIIIDIKERKVEAVENKTTPAGTWECYKITYTTEMTSKVGTVTLSIMKPRTVTEWFSFKVGAVRSETFKNGELEGYSELTKFNKPQ
ncbi:MAG: DUF3108 domain-containing protein [Bacteroidia bacterium]|nr:DUF3108 domain-containing protein [Bacteroidia bacterium]